MNAFKKMCVGVYKGFSFLASPFVKVWNKSSDALYNTVNQQNNETLPGADMTGLNNNKVDTSSTPSVSNSSNNSSDNSNTNDNNRVNKKDSVLDFSQKTTKNVFVSQKLKDSRNELLALVEAQNDTRADHPIIYRYKAVNPEGKWIANTFISYSRSEAFIFLENEGNTVYKIETSPTIEKMYGPKSFGSSKMKTKDIVFWLQQLSTYLRSGIPLTDSMRILGKQMGNDVNNRRIFDGIIYNLTLGESFSSALEKQTNAFPSLLVNIIKASEATGDLEGSLDDMADYYGETEKTRKAMISALTYPAIVFVFSIAVVIFLLVFLVPKFKGIYNSAGAQINRGTAFLLDVSAFLQNNWSKLLLVVLIIIITLIILYKKVKAVRIFMQTMAMKMPIFGKIIIYKEMMIFTKTFANLLNNNVFITESMDILQKTTNNEIYREIMINTVDYIGRGEKISSAFKNHWAVPDVAYYMMVTGESTGELALMMQNVANYYSLQHKSMIDSMKSLIEPVMILFLAITVGGIVIAVIVPMFNLYNSIL